MRKLFGIFLAILIGSSVQFCLAEGWDDYAGLEHAWDGQKTITNQEFEQVMDALQEKSKKKEARKKKRRAKKISGGGTSLHNELDPDKIIPELESVKPLADDLLVNVPVDLIVDGKMVEKGYYNVLGERDKETKKIYLNFYQAHYLKAKIEATETEDDYGEEEVNFVDIKNYNDSFVKLIFGSIDFNAYAYVPFVKE